jgi:hypothetical protein
MGGSTLLSEFTVLKMNNLVWKKNDVVCDKLAKSTDCSKHYCAHGFASSPLLNLKLKNDVKNLLPKKKPQNQTQRAPNDLEAVLQKLALILFH